MYARSTRQRLQYDDDAHLFTILPVNPSGFIYKSCHQKHFQIFEIEPFLYNNSSRSRSSQCQFKIRNFYWSVNEFGFSERTRPRLFSFVSSFFSLELEIEWHLHYHFYTRLSPSNFKGNIHLSFHTKKETKFFPNSMLRSSNYTTIVCHFHSVRCAIVRLECWKLSLVKHFTQIKHIFTKLVQSELIE